MKWEASEEGSTTRKLYFPSADTRLQGSYAQPDSMLTQFLTGHGNSGACFHRFTIQTDRQCLCICQESPENVEHILFDCPEYGKERCVLKTHLLCCNIIYQPPLYEVFKRACCKSAFRRFVSSAYKKLRGQENTSQVVTPHLCY
jgi:hypothetical protein